MEDLASSFENHFVTWVSRVDQSFVIYCYISSLNDSENSQFSRSIKFYIAFCSE